MRIESPFNFDVGLKPKVRGNPIAPTPTGTQVSATPAPAPASEVAINGQTLLRQRVFFSVPDREPPVITDKKLMNANLPLAQYLTMEDRAVLGDIYEFSQSEGIDLTYVDRLAFSLANYRTNDDGKLRSPHNQGKAYDLEGHRLSCSFTDKDTIIADRIKQSDALRGVRLDLGFIGFETDKNYSSLTHSHLGFLELVVNRFSSTGEVMSVDPGFQKHEYVENDFIIYKSKETYQISGVSVDAVAKDYQSAAKSSVLETNDAQGHPLKLRQAIHKYLQQNAIPTLFQTIARLRR